MANRRGSEKSLLQQERAPLRSMAEAGPSPRTARSNAATAACKEHDAEALRNVLAALEPRKSGVLLWLPVLRKLDCAGIVAFFGKHSAYEPGKTIGVSQYADTGGRGRQPPPFGW